MKKKKVIIGIIIIIIVLVGVGLWLWNKSEKEVMKRGLKDVLYYEQGTVAGDVCLIGDKIHRSWLIEGRHILFPRFKYKKYEMENFNAYGTPEIDYAKVDFYDLVTKKKLGTADLTQTVEAYLEKGYLWDVGIRGYQTAVGENYLILEFMREDRWIHVYVNADTGKVTETGWLEDLEPTERTGDVLERERNEERDRDLIEADEIGLLENIYGEQLKWGDIWIYRDVPGECEIVLRKELLPQENRLLYTDFPGLKKYENPDYKFVKFYFSRDLTQEEILSMLIEEGEEISFEGCVLPAESSIDGKEHEIHSFEEYEQWKKYEE